MQISSGESPHSAPNQLFDLTGVSATRAYGREAHVHNKPITLSEGEKLCPALPEVSNRGIHMPRNFNARWECLPKRVVG
jgi:hypothetical protein